MKEYGLDNRTTDNEVSEWTALWGVLLLVGGIVLAAAGAEIGGWAYIVGAFLIFGGLAALSEAWRAEEEDRKVDDALRFERKLARRRAEEE